jgi:hypothetical protein
VLIRTKGQERWRDQQIVFCPQFWMSFKINIKELKWHFLRPLLLHALSWAISMHTHHRHRKVAMVSLLSKVNTELPKVHSHGSRIPTLVSLCSRAEGLWQCKGLGILGCGARRPDFLRAAFYFFIYKMGVIIFILIPLRICEAVFHHIIYLFTAIMRAYEYKALKDIRLYLFPGLISYTACRF